MRLRRPLELGDVAAVELDVLGRRERPAHVLCEPDRDQLVATAPEEQRAWLDRLEAAPELLALIEVDAAGGL